MMNLQTSHFMIGPEESATLSTVGLSQRSANAQISTTCTPASFQISMARSVPGKSKNKERGASYRTQHSGPCCPSWTKVKDGVSSLKEGFRPGWYTRSTLLEPKSTRRTHQKKPHTDTQTHIYASISSLTYSPSSTRFKTNSPKLLSFVEQVCSTRAEVDNLGAPVSVLFEPSTFGAVVRVRDTYMTARDMQRNGKRERERERTFQADGGII